MPNKQGAGGGQHQCTLAPKKNYTLSTACISPGGEQDGGEEHFLFGRSTTLCTLLRIKQNIIGGGEVSIGALSRQTYFLHTPLLFQTGWKQRRGKGALVYATLETSPTFPLKKAKKTGGWGGVNTTYSRDQSYPKNTISAAVSSWAENKGTIEVIPFTVLDKPLHSCNK